MCKHDFIFNSLFCIRPLKAVARTDSDSRFKSRLHIFDLLSFSAKDLEPVLVGARLFSILAAKYNTDRSCKDFEIINYDSSVAMTKNCLRVTLEL